MEPDSDRLLTGINTEYLCQHWVHSYEEQVHSDRDEIHLYRPEGFKEFPPNPFRVNCTFYKNGDCEWLFWDLCGGRHFLARRWRIDPSDKSVLQIIKEDSTTEYRIRIVELTKDILRKVFLACA